MVSAFFQEPNAKIAGKALDEIASDKSMLAKRQDMVDEI
jgi:hypothetical protein